MMTEPSPDPKPVRRHPRTGQVLAPLFEPRPPRGPVARQRGKRQPFRSEPDWVLRDYLASARQVPRKADCHFGRWLGLPKMEVEAWVVLMVLEHGELLLSVHTVPGAHVERRAVRVLQKRGFAECRREPSIGERGKASITVEYASLTPEGHHVLELLRDKRLKGKP